MLLKCVRATALTLLFTLTACDGFDTGLNPRTDVRNEQGPLTMSPPEECCAGLHLNRFVSPAIYSEPGHVAHISGV